MSSESDRILMPPPPLVALAGWFIPGAGYVMIGQRKQSVETLSMLAQEEASQLRIGPAAAYAVVLFVYVSLVAYAFVKLLGADVIGEARVRAKENKQRKAKAAVA